MCECYKVGGPFIAEDPDCPVHGRDVQEHERDHDYVIQDLTTRVENLERIVASLAHNES